MLSNPSETRWAGEYLRLYILLIHDMRDIVTLIAPAVQEDVGSPKKTWIPHWDQS